eukprot:15470314-Alexandrium_andersonii.AAC.1
MASAGGHNPIHNCTQPAWLTKHAQSHIGHSRTQPATPWTTKATSHGRLKNVLMSDCARTAPPLTMPH